MVDEYNRPLYGDPFGVLGEDAQTSGDDVEKELWGQMDPEAEGEPSHIHERLSLVV